VGPRHLQPGEHARERGARLARRHAEKFSQADSSDTRKKGGTGLGLAITKELVEQMGGMVGFDSDAGKGACFYFELPVCEDAR
jgi:signal transduction histidine kinase